MEIPKKEVEGLIEVERKDTFLSHIKTAFSFDDYIPFGEIQKNQITLWKQDSWNRMFYPIFTLEFNSKNHLINISDRLNPVGKLFCYIGILLMLYILIPEDIEYFDIRLDWQPLTVKLFIFIIIFFLAKKAHKINVIDHLEQIYNQLDIEIEKTKPENEWSLKNILIRLFMYPICVFLLFICFVLLIPNGDYIRPIPVFILVSRYFYTDIKILLKK